MLGEMNRPAVAHVGPSRRGVTLIELMVALTLLGLLVALAVPSMSAMIQRKRVQGTASELMGVLRQARVMPFNVNTKIVVSFGNKANEFTCYSVHDDWPVDPSKIECDCTRYPLDSCPGGKGHTSYSTVIIPASTGVSVVAGTKALAFDAQGTTLNASTLTVSVASPGVAEMEVHVSSSGLATQCAVSGMSGYDPCAAK